MRKGWRGEKYRHVMSSKGISSSILRDLDLDIVISNWEKRNVPSSEQSKMIENIFHPDEELIRKNKKKLSKSNLAIDHLEDLHNLYVSRTYVHQNIPFGILIDAEELDKYGQTEYFLTYNEQDTHPEHYNPAIRTSPSFKTKEELNEWWLKHGKDVAKIIHGGTFKKLEQKHEKELDRGEEYPNFDNLYNMKMMFNKFIRQPKSYYVNVYHADKSYGGAEEGGWWYDTEEPLYTVRVKNEKEAQKWFNELSQKYPYTGKRNNVYGGTDYNVRIQYKPGTDYYPQVRPRYR